MRRVREWLAAPDKLTDREAQAVVAGCYLLGYLLAMAWDEYRERERRALDIAIRQMSADFKDRINQMRLEVPRPDAEKGGPK